MTGTVPVAELVRQHEIRLTEAQKRYLAVKRLADVGIAAVALGVLAPVRSGGASINFYSCATFYDGMRMPLAQRGSN